MTKLTNGVVSDLLSLIANNNLIGHQEALEEFVTGIDIQTRKEELNSLGQTMRGVWNNGKIKLSKKEGILILKNIIDQLQEFLKEGQLKNFNLVIFREMVNWADSGFSQSLAFDAKAKARELKIDIN